MVSVIGYYTTRFGELWNKSLFDLVEDAIRGVLDGTEMDVANIDAIFFGNMLAGVLENNLHTTSKIAEILSVNIPVFRVESACASGGIAFHLAAEYVTSHPGKTVMVVGAEKMTDYSPEEVATGLASAASGEEQESGITFPGLYALMARTYMENHKTPPDALCHVSYKNHFHAQHNEKAQFRYAITYEQAAQSPLIADPLRVLDCSPISDGASAVIISSNQTYVKKHPSIKVLSSQVATDSISLKNRRRIDGIDATVIASKKAFKEAKITPGDINIAEIHDCFTIAELFAMEDIGFWKKGEAGHRIKHLETMLGSGSRLTVNTSGGLKAAGHPVGATGVKQIGEVYLQLTGRAGKRQIKKCSYGLAHNVGGSGGTAVITIFGI